MIPTLFKRSRALQGAAVFLAASVGGASLMVRSTIRGTDGALPPPAQMGDVATLSGPARRGSPDIEAAVENDLFSPDRSAPARDYRMPGEATGADSARDVAREPVVLGTAVSADGSNFATCRLGASEPRIVRVGDRLGEYVVKSIDRGHVVFGAPHGTRIDVVAQKPQA